MADTVWENLFDRAVDCLDSCSNQMPGLIRWSFGGGTALMLQLGHRRSKDIDIFVNYVEALPLLSPRLNSRADALAHDYIEAQNFVKLNLPQGTIDFIVAPHLTSDPWHQTDIRGRTVLLETPWEIVIKKLFFRTSTLQVRDVFDAAVVLRHHLEEMRHNSGLLWNKIDLLCNRLDMLQSRYQKEAVDTIDVLPAGQALLGDAPDVVRNFLESVRDKRFR